MTRADPAVVEMLRRKLEQDCRGMGHAAHLDELARWLGVHSRRVTEAAAALVEAGVPVGSRAGVGLWLIETEQEKAQALRGEVNRLRSIARRVRALDRAFAERLQGVLEGIA